jgi:septal ring factor EnvC (AmiA/AmiB activator)
MSMTRAGIGKMRTGTGGLLLCLCVVSAATYADPTDLCAALEGSALAQCRSNEQTLRQRQLEQQLQQQEERQNQLDKQQRDVQQTLESMRVQNELLRKQLAHEAANQPAPSVAIDDSKRRDVQSWRSDNPWYGTDYARTAFATRYVKRLQKERPELTGRPLLDALSAKVNDTFGPEH